MSGIDFKSFLIGILITVIFVFTTGISSGGSGKYVVSCTNSFCFTLNTETGIGKYVVALKRTDVTGVEIIEPGNKPDF
jgi:hypothetical protein